MMRGIDYQNFKTFFLVLEKVISYYYIYTMVCGSGSGATFVTEYMYDADYDADYIYFKNHIYNGFVINETD